MAYLVINMVSDIIYVAGTVNGMPTTFAPKSGRWYGYAPTAPDNTYRIWVEAYDEAGNRSEYETEIYYEGLQFITDRVQADVDSRAQKAFLNANDMNRIEGNAGLICAMVAIPATAKSSWSVGGLPRASDWERIIGYVQRIREYAHRQTTPAVPDRPINYFQKVNDVEHILQDAFLVLDGNARSISYAGEIFAGEGGLL